MRLGLDQHGCSASQPERIPLRTAGWPIGLQLRRERLKAEEPQEGAVTIFGKVIGRERRQPAHARQLGFEEVGAAVHGQLDPAETPAGALRLRNAHAVPPFLSAWLKAHPGVDSG